jgi:TPR repeat protein
MIADRLKTDRIDSMKPTNLLAGILLLLFAIAVNLPAQQAEADRRLFQQIKAKAEEGDAEAQSNVGFCYERGVGVLKDETEAIKWYRKAAAQGQVLAQYNIGVCYYFGIAVTKDSVEAVKWFRLAAIQGLAEAQSNLGVCYGKGEGLTKNEAEAANWFRKAAEKGHAEAQVNLGACYYFGTGVSKDQIEAIKWYRKAAEQGLLAAQSNLGICYSNGDGVHKDPTEAVNWYLRAAKQGDGSAQAAVGARYFLGEGVPKDYVKAHKWINLASAQGVESAKKSLSTVELLMTPDQIAEAQKLAREFSLEGARPVTSQDRFAGPLASGTGFFISEDGFLVTNEHVVRNATLVHLVADVGLISAKVVKVDAANDLALLKVEGRFAVLPVAASRGVKLGGTVATVGFPNIGLQGFAPKLAKGEIASLSGAQDDARYFQISVPVQPGNSGGALVDERGNVVGVVSAKLSARAALSTSGALPENINYAVKSSYLLSFLESVPEVAAKLKEPESKERKFEDVVKSAEQAAVLVLVY